MSLLKPLRYTACRVPNFSMRSLSTTAYHRSVAPESPHYVDLPSTPTVRAFKAPPPKGKLPRPRPIELTQSAGPATLEPKVPRKANPGADAEKKSYVAWKSKMAEVRRRNLREGLAALQARTAEREARRRAIFERRNEDREKLLAEKMREDVRLTLPSVLSTLRMDQGIKVARMAPGRVEEKRQLRLAKEREKTEAKLEHLHELYLNAREFLLTEKDLDEAIEREFQPRNQLLRGYPPTMGSLLKDMEGAGYTIGVGSVPRITEVGGALTGGRLTPGKRKEKIVDTDTPVQNSDYFKFSRHF